MRCCKIDSKKDIKITIRLSAEDYKFLSDCAYLYNSSVSDVIRRFIKYFRFTDIKTL